jgi:hypothetical protein
MSEDDRDEENDRLEEEMLSEENENEDVEAGFAVVPPVEASTQEGLDEYGEEPRQLQARDHTYLPGASHPLMPESLLSSGNKKRRTARSCSLLQSDNDDGLVQIPLLVLPPGVVIFPGSTLPIRLRHTRWIQYLGNKVAFSRRGGTEEICIGVLTQVNPIASGRRQSSARSSWMRTGIDRRRSEHIVNILKNMNVLLADDEAGDNDEEEESESSEEEEVRHQPPRDPLLGRIGTMVTIINTHGDAVTDSSDWTSQEGSRVWRQPTDQLVVTALGTGRFGVVKSADNGESGRSNTLSAAGHYDGDLSAMVRFYCVQEMCDDELIFPPLQLLPSAGRPLHATTTRHDRIIHSLSNVSSIPNFVLQTCGLRKLLPTCKSYRTGEQFKGTDVETRG